MTLEELAALEATLRSQHASLLEERDFDEAQAQIDEQLSNLGVRYRTLLSGYTPQRDRDMDPPAEWVLQQMVCAPVVARIRAGELVAEADKVALMTTLSSLLPHILESFAQCVSSDRASALIVPALSFSGSARWLGRTTNRRRTIARSSQARSTLSASSSAAARTMVQKTATRTTTWCDRS